LLGGRGDMGSHIYEMYSLTISFKIVVALVVVLRHRDFVSPLI